MLGALTIPVTLGKRTAFVTEWDGMVLTFNCVGLFDVNDAPGNDGTSTLLSITLGCLKLT